MYYGTVPVLSVSRIHPVTLFCQDLDRSTRYILSNVPEILQTFFYQLQIFKFIWFSWLTVNRDICKICLNSRISSGIAFWSLILIYSMDPRPWTQDNYESVQKSLRGTVADTSPVPV
jgi:hypothetical protein